MTRRFFLNKNIYFMTGMRHKLIKNIQESMTGDPDFFTHFYYLSKYKTNP